MVLVAPGRNFQLVTKCHRLKIDKIYVVHLYSKRDRLLRFDRILQATVITVTLTCDKTLFESIDL